MKVEIGKEFLYLTWRFIMAFLGDWTGSADRRAGGVIRNATFGKYCKISKEISPPDRFWSVGALTRDWVPNSAPITTRHLSESSL
jgi:hypothetical protein